MSGYRFRSVSLRILVFGVVPLFAITFFLIRWRIDVADWQLTAMRGLAELGVLIRDDQPYYEEASFDDQDWWDAFWGKDLCISEDAVLINGSQEQCDAISVLSSISAIKFTKIDNSIPSVRIRRLLHQHPNVNSVHLAFSNPGPGFCKEIARIPRLKSFTARRSTITDEFLEPLANLPLETLAVPGCASVTDVACTTISTMRQLKHLDLARTSVTDRGIALLGDLRLESLDLVRDKIHGDGLARLNGKRLRQLYLSGTELSDDSLQAIGKMQQLRHLGLSRTNISNLGIAHLGNLKNMETLDLSSNRISDDGIANLSRMTKLKTLWCDLTYCAPAAINSLADQLTMDRSGKVLNVNWDGAGLIETRTGEFVGYVPSFAHQLTATHGICWDRDVSFRSYFPLRIDTSEPTEPVEGSVRYAVASGAKLTLLDTPSRHQVSQFAVPNGLTYQREVRTGPEHVFLFDLRGITAWSHEGQKKWSKACLQLPIPSSSDGITVVAGAGKVAVNGKGQLEVFTATAGELVASNLRKVDQPVPASVQITSPVMAVAFDQSGRTISVRQGKGQLEVCDFEADNILCTIRWEASAVVISPDARLLATHDEKSREVVIWDAFSGDRISRTEFDVRHGRMQFTPDGKYLMVDAIYQMIDAKYR